MKRIFTITALLTMSFFMACAQTHTEKEAEYLKTITLRADKILTPLHLSDSVKYRKTRDIIIFQYLNLNAIHEGKNIAVKEEKAKTALDKTKIESRLKAIEENASQKLSVLHNKFLTGLEENLTNEQVELVKNGMTYNVLNVTYKAYQDMIPALKTSEKEQILTWLTEARELAMDAGTSDGKHHIFGKYKGRINNYLSKAGYDLQKERKDWEERFKEAKSN